MHSLEIVQWDSTRRDHPGYPGRVSGLGLVILVELVVRGLPISICPCGLGFELSRRRKKRAGD